MLKKKAFGVILLLIILAMVNPGGESAAMISPDRIIQVAKLNGGEHSALFGYSLALVGNTLAVGDPYDSQLGNEAGAVTIFRAEQAGTWKEVARVIPTDGEAGIRFGRDVALSGDLLVVGAPFDNDFGERSGSAYIFARNEGGLEAWGQVAKLTASDAFSNDQFGWAVSIDGDRVAAGAYTKMYGGRVYIFEVNPGKAGEWVEVAQLNPDPPGFQACFGEALDLEGDMLAVGAYGGGDYSGSAYIFKHDPLSGNWQRLANFKAADTYAYHYFAYSIALNDWTVLAGAPGADGLAGVAYIFTADPAQPEVWEEQARLTASDRDMGDYFGLALDLSGDYAWIGAPLNREASGATYVFERNAGEAGQWDEVIRLVGDDTIVGDEFGYAVSIEANLAAAGAPGHPANGSAYIFDLNPAWIIRFPVITH